MPPPRPPPTSARCNGPLGFARADAMAAFGTVDRPKTSFPWLQRRGQPLAGRKAFAYDHQQPKRWSGSWASGNADLLQKRRVVAFQKLAVSQVALHANAPLVERDVLDPH